VSDAQYRAAITCGPLLSRVLDRLLGALAARADLSVDRLNDLSLVGDAVSAAAADSVTNGRLHVIATPGTGALDVSFGPFVPGGAARVRRAGSLPGGGDLFSSVAKQIDVEAEAGGKAERLKLRIDR
jgi:hypothetical protein